MVVKSNKDKLMKQALMGKVAPPVMAASGRSTYVTTWDGKPKIGIGVGGIKYNVKMGDPCLGWPETEYMTPGVALFGTDEKAEYDRRSVSESGTAFTKLSCIGNKVTVVGGDAKGSKGVVTGKGGVGGTSRHVLSHFPKDVLSKLNIGDKMRVASKGVGLKVEGFDGKLFNMDPKFLEALEPELNGDILELPVAKEIPVIAMGMGVGGSSAESGGWCVQVSPPHLVEMLGLGDLRFGDLVACNDALMSYGKGYYKGAITVGVVTTGESQVAGHGPTVMAIASSKHGKIKARVDATANVAKYLELEG